MDVVPLAKIRTDGGTQMRTAINTETMLEYRDKWKSGIVFDPIDVFFDGVTHWLADGFHRFYGAREAKRKDIPANVHHGTVRDAVLFACGANGLHGLRRTNADKRVAVLALLNDEEWTQWSDRVIAEKCGVSDPFVGGIRNEVLTVSTCDDEPRPRKGKDGKRYKQRRRKQKPSPKPASSHDDEPDEPTTPPTKPRKAAPQECIGFLKFKALWSMATPAEKCLIRDWIEQNP